MGTFVLIRPAQTFYERIKLGFEVESGRRTEDKIKRPVFFGENAQPGLQYEIDAWHPVWLAGLEIEAGRAWMGNAVYRDLIQALVMVDMEHLAGCGRKVRRSAAVYGASTVSAAFGM